MTQADPGQTPYAGAPYTAPAYAAAQTAPAGGSRNPLGTASLIIGVAVVLLGFVLMVVSAVVLAGGDFGVLSLINVVNTFVGGILALVGTVLGIMGVAAKNRPKVAAGIGLGACGATLVGILSSFAYTGLLTLLG